MRRHTSTTKSQHDIEKNLEDAPFVREVDEKYIQRLVFNASSVLS
jgi:hypothetical protein